MLSKLTIWIQQKMLQIVSSFLKNEAKSALYRWDKDTFYVKPQPWHCNDLRRFGNTVLHSLWSIYGL